MYFALIGGAEGGNAMDCVGQHYAEHNWIRIIVAILILAAIHYVLRKVLKRHSYMIVPCTVLVGLVVLIITGIIIATTTQSDCTIL